MSTKVTLNELVENAIDKCKTSKINNYNFSIFALLEWTTGKTKLNYLTNPEQIIAIDCCKKFNNAVEQLIENIPLYRIIGKRCFFGLELNLNSDTLDPRCDTEIVVELAIKHIDSFLKTYNKLDFLDMGVGSGAISLALLHHYKQANVNGTALDISANCIKATYENAKKYNLISKLKLIESNWFANLSGKFDLIISNPPYIPSFDINNLGENVKKYDPIKALDGGIDGLDFYRDIAKNAHNYLTDNGFIVLEIGATQRQEVINIFKLYNYFLADSSKDYAQLDRALVFKRIFN